eukprot:scaffold11174_cov56-Phaeocystis_antarctica.AAC.3
MVAASVATLISFISRFASSIASAPAASTSAECLAGLHRLRCQRPGDAHHATHALGDGGLLDQSEGAQLGRCGDVRAAAQLDRVRLPLGTGRRREQLLDGRTDGDDAHGVGRLVERHRLDVHGQLRLHRHVDQLLHLLALRRRHGLGVREVEARLGLVDQRALLRDALSEDLVQREVEDVGERVRLAYELPPLPLDAALEVRPRGQAALLERAHVQHIAAEGLHRAHPEGGAAAQRRVGVGGGRIDEARTRVDRAQRRRLADVLALELVLVVSEGHAAREQRAVALGRGGGGGGARLLLVHRRLEASGVDLEAHLARHQLREVEGEAHRVVQEEGGLAVEARLAAGLDGVCALVELLDAAREHAAEGGLLLGDDILHELLLRGELGEGLRQRGDGAGHQRREEALVRTEHLSAVTDGAAQDTPQHVAAPLVGRQGAVGDGDGEGADVVGDDTVRGVAADGGLGQHLRRAAQLAAVGSRARDPLDLAWLGLGLGLGLGLVLVLGLGLGLGVGFGVRGLSRSRRRWARRRPCRSWSARPAGWRPAARSPCPCQYSFRGAAGSRLVGVRAGVGVERPQLAARLTVELHEDEVPHLEHVRVVLVHVRGRVRVRVRVRVRGVAPADAIVVDLRARTAPG